jgi:hypothetical protein
MRAKVQKFFEKRTKDEKMLMQATQITSYDRANCQIIDNLQEKP